MCQFFYSPKKYLLINKLIIFQIGRVTFDRYVTVICQKKQGYISLPFGVYFFTPSIFYIEFGFFVILFASSTLFEEFVLANISDIFFPT